MKENGEVLSKEIFYQFQTSFWLKRHHPVFTLEKGIQTLDIR